MPSGDAAGTLNLLDMIRAAAKVKLNRNGNTPAPGSDATGAAIRPRKAVAGQGFIDWILSGEGQADIAAYRRGGHQLFFPNAAR